MIYINRHAVFHEPKSRWAYAADRDTLHIRLRTARGDINRVGLIATDPFNWKLTDGGRYVFDEDSMFRRDMVKEYRDDLFDYWFCELGDIPTKRTRYSFVLEHGEERTRFTARGFSGMDKSDLDTMEEWFNFPFICEEDVFDAPEWAANTVWYQIFCDRFARHGEGDIVWGSKSDGIHFTFYGGNLKGVTEKLPYIAEMGFNGIYFTPIFSSPSTHKYDTEDYFHIDPQFGTNDDFRELVNMAHGLGIRIMLDAVFNHCGFSHPFFQDVVKNGKNSPYYDHFHILDESVHNFTVKDRRQQTNIPYRTFAYTPRMPKWNTANPGAREYLLKAARYWVEEYDIDGWRLDVSNEVSHDFWREMRKAVIALKPDFFILGENWDDTYPWLMGDQFDSTMNYMLLGAIIDFASGKTDAEGFATALTRDVLVTYPKPQQRVMFNMLESHDTDRVMTLCDCKTGAVRLAYVLQMTLSGAPSVYYGGEIGMDGAKHGDGNRRCMPWDTEIPEERDFRPLLKKLIALRKKHPSFRAVDMEFVDCGGGSLIYRKKAGGETLTVAVNNSADEKTITLSTAAYIDLLSEESASGGEITLPPYGFSVFIH